MRDFFSFSHENVRKAVCKRIWMTNFDIFSCLLYLRGKKATSVKCSRQQTAYSIIFLTIHYGRNLQICSKNLKRFCLLKYLKVTIWFKLLTKLPIFTLASNHIYFLTNLESIVWFRCFSDSGHGDITYMLHCVWHYKKALIVGPIVGKIVCRIHSVKSKR